MTKIISLEPRTIYNSAGGKAIEVEITTETGQKFTGSAPAGISVGKNEIPIVPADLACQEIKEKISPVILQGSFTQEELDQILEKSNSGANTTLAISIAFAKANHSLSTSSSKKLPRLMILVFEGGKHGNKNIKIQEFMTIVETFSDGLKTYYEVKDHLIKENFSICVGNEGGFSPQGINDYQTLEILSKYSKTIALDIANSYAKIPLEEIEKLLKDFPIFSIEDPVEEENWTLWKQFSEKFGEKTMIIADDLTVTNPELIEKGAQLGCYQGVIIKPNQQGTITRAIKAVETARLYNLKVIVSHRGNETNEDFIADFALAVNADFVKFGAPSRGERIAKYNRLIQLAKTE